MIRDNTYLVKGKTHIVEIDMEDVFFTSNLFIERNELVFSDDILKETNVNTFIDFNFKENSEFVRSYIKEKINLNKLRKFKFIEYNDEFYEINHIDYPKVTISNEFKKEKIIDFNDIVSFHVLIPNYEEDSKIKSYKINLFKDQYELSYHAQERIIERGIFSKTKLKQMIEVSRNSFKISKKKTSKNEQRFYSTRFNLIFVVLRDKKKIVTAYPFKGSKEYLTEENKKKEFLKNYKSFY